MLVEESYFVLLEFYGIDELVFVCLGRGDRVERVYGQLGGIRQEVYCHVVKIDLGRGDMD